MINLTCMTQGIPLEKVIQDDVGAYHLFYADGLASPGTDLTFFDYPDAGPSLPGANQIAEIGLRVQSPAALEWWQSQLAENGLATGPLTQRYGREILEFKDPEGLPLALVVDASASAHPWEHSQVQPERQIVGLGPVAITVTRPERTERVLEEILGFRRLPDYTDSADREVHVFIAGEEGPGSELHVRVERENKPGYAGAGSVHHVAFRVPDAEQHREWAAHLSRSEIRHSGVIDRFYFKALYFREPNGILFELSTDGPGFATDEPLELLGERLSLPPFLESRRAEIEAGLRPL
jgi:glyoxalase family protein